MKARVVITIAATSALLFAGACGDDNDQDPGVPNPAAAYCEQRGGTTSGPEPMCELPDGSIVDAWDFYRTETDSGAGLANPAAVFCEEQGGTTSGPEPMCELADGSVVDAWDYFRQEGLED
jgi:putative hemolysin